MDAKKETEAGMQGMEWLDAMRSINGNSSYLVRWMDRAVQGVDHAVPWLVGLAGGTLGYVAGAFSALFCALVILWCADMALGNLRAIADEEILWSPSKNLDGVLRLLVYGILGVCLVTVEEFVRLSTGVSIEGVLLGGGYAVCVLGETKSIMQHIGWFVPGFDGYAEKVLAAIRKLTANGKKK